MKGGISMLYNFYNYYLNTYMPKTESKYDAHKRSELKSLYEAIVKLNKESPLYLVHMTDGLQNDVIAIKEHARSLRNSIASISEAENNDTLKMFSDKILTSSNNKIISVNYIGSEKDIESAPVFEVDVEQLASAQVNRGYYIDSARSILPSGTYSFHVTISNMTYEFQFLVKDTEDNKDILKKVSNMINRSDIGLLTTVETNTTGDKQRIVLTSTSTGTTDFRDITFNINEDNTSFLEGSISYLGLDQIDQMPTDSKFSINKIPRTSTSNTFTVNKVYELTLHNTTLPDESVTISFQDDRQATFAKINTFVEAYNDMIYFINDTASPLRKNSKLFADIASIAMCYKNELDSMGLVVQEDSTLTINSDLLNQTIEKEALGDGTYASLRSFRNPLSRKINNVLLNPMEYIDKTIVTYPNTSYKHANVYAVSMYSGMMFNGYC